jgi:hypothetical protein
VAECAANHAKEPIGFAWIDDAIKPTPAEFAVIRRFLLKFHKPQTLAEHCRERDKETQRKARNHVQ